MTTETRITRAAMACEMIKVARDEWLTKDEIADRIGIGMNTAPRWIKEYVANGILLRRIRRKTVHDGRKSPAEYCLAPEWGGLALASPKCALRLVAPSVHAPTERP